MPPPIRAFRGGNEKRESRTDGLFIGKSPDGDKYQYRRKFDLTLQNTEGTDIMRIRVGETPIYKVARRERLGEPQPGSLGTPAGVPAQIPIPQWKFWAKNPPMR